MKGLVRIWVAVIGLAGVAAAGTIDLDLVDEKGVAVSGVRCGIVDSSSGNTRATFEGLRYDGPIAPRKGDRLYVYKRGFDLFKRTLVAGDSRVSGMMVRATDRFRLVLANDTEAGQAPRVDVVSLPSNVRRGSRPVKDSQTFRLGKEGVVVLLPRGMDTSFFVTARDRLPWPVTHAPRPDETCVIRIEPERAVRARYPVDVETNTLDVLCLPDFQWQPAVEPSRVDAWRWFLNGPGWLAKQLEGRAAVIRICPDVPFHLFARIDGVPHYRKIEPSASRIVLTGTRLRRLHRRPTIDGAAAEKGTIIAPGVLDLHAVARLVDYFDAARDGFFHAAGPATAVWPAPRLPDARWLTLWEPGSGIAYVEWGDDRDRPLNAPRATGTIAFELEAGVRVEGDAAVYPVWKGARTVRTVPPLEGLRRSFAGGPLVFRGLPLGHYGVSLDVRLTDRAGRPVATRTYFECETGATIKLPMVRR